MAKIKDTDYLFSTARVRSIEKYMLTHEKVEKMIDAKTTEDALKVLYDSNYGDVNEQISVNDYEKLLTQEHKKTYDFIMSIAPELDNFNMFLYTYDYHNLKVIMKSEYLGIDSSDLLVNTGSIDIKKLNYAVKERDFSGLTENMALALKEIIEVFPKNKDPQVIDIIFDKYCYEEMLNSAKSLNSKFIEDYIRLQIDTINLKTYVRLRKMNKSWDFFSKVYIKGGKISEQIFIKNYDETFEKFADELFAFDLRDEFIEGTESLEETGKFTALEKIFDNKLLNHVKSAKYISYGIEPLVGYLIAKDNEIKIARIILAGKIAGISSELIKERLRETYV
ncbi:V-type ATP synthase subunit C [Sedimentibacter sp. MB31-C6]|uniref:V-type ATP synthase subunit C n=1 Tax=Sedimentibacter sp. MB31-C6 TaxID=3109366 RepID=UPI002DDD6F03|nr:V-type ATP synthase subunit C [Sedimentibacter sp. MB36-C1]WSI05353.1 V-type ATP synthase subunit C [Sedimentibacter sp. MB36-C1]